MEQKNKHDPYAWASVSDPFYDNDVGDNIRLIVMGRIEYLNRVQSLGGSIDDPSDDLPAGPAAYWAYLRRKLFYNKIWVDNMLELVWKYAPRQIKDLEDYMSYMSYGGINSDFERSMKNIDRIIDVIYRYNPLISGGFYYNGNNRRWKIFNSVDREVTNYIMKNIKVMTMLTKNNGPANRIDLRDIPNGRIVFLGVDQYDRYIIYDLPEWDERFLSEPLVVPVTNHNKTASVLYRTTGFITDCIYKREPMKFVCPIRFTKMDTSSIPDPIRVDLTEAEENSLISLIEVECPNYDMTESIQKVVCGFLDVYKSWVPHQTRWDVPIIYQRYLYVGDIDNILHLYEPNISKDSAEPETITPEMVFEKDILVEYPVDGFDKYLSLLENSINNPNCSSICMTLYRIGDDPTLMNLLVDAVGHGIEVTVNIELNARGDESRNANWVREMKRNHINVITACNSEIHKVHSKLTLIKFTDRAIAQIGTGNYHTVTTTQYTDLSLITADPEICADVRKIFSYLIDIHTYSLYNSQHIFDDCRSVPSLSGNTMITPGEFRTEFISLIAREGFAGKDGYIAIKCNELSDPVIIGALKTAYEMGCHIDMIVRGACCFPIPYNSQGICKSIVWDKLEHSRVYCFGRTNPDIYIGSLDLVKQKIDHRLETLVRVTDPDIVLRLTEYMNEYITNTTNAWIVVDQGFYTNGRDLEEGGENDDKVYGDDDIDEE